METESFTEQYIWLTHLDYIFILYIRQRYNNLKRHLHHLCCDVIHPHSYLFPYLSQSTLILFNIFNPSYLHSAKEAAPWHQERPAKAANTFKRGLFNLISPCKQRSRVFSGSHMLLLWREKGEGAG